MSQQQKHTSARINGGRPAAAPARKPWRRLAAAALAAAVPVLAWTASPPSATAAQGGDNPRGGAAADPDPMKNGRDPAVGAPVPADIARAPGTTPAGDALLDEGTRAFARGDTPGAIAAWERARDVYFAAGDNHGVATALRNVAAGHITLGAYEKQAQPTLLAALDFADKPPNRPLVVSIRSMLATTQTFLQKYDAAHQTILLARADLGEPPADGQADPYARLRAGLENNAGNLEAAQVGEVRTRVKYRNADVPRDRKEADDRQAAALAHYDAAARLAAGAGDARLEAKARANASVAAARDVVRPDDDPPASDEQRAALAAAFAGRVRQARDLAAVATERATALPDSRDKVNLLLTAGQADQQIAAAAKAAPDPKAVDRAAVRASVLRARQSLDAAQQAAARIGDAWAEAYATGFLGSLYEEHGTVDDAKRLALRANFLAQQVQDQHSMYRWQWLYARLLRRDMDKARAAADPAAYADARDRAIAAYGRALDTLEKVKGDKVLGFGNGDTRQTFRKEVAPIYYQAADLFLQRSADAGRSDDDRRLDLLAARDTIETLKGGELASYFRDPCEATLPKRPIGQVGQGTAIVYFIPLEDRTELLVEVAPPAGTPRSGKDGENLLRLPPVPVTAAEIDRTVNEFRRFLEIRASDQYLDLGQELYDDLVKPIEPLLTERGVDTLVFVPDGALRTVPMAALFDGEKFLIERYAVAVVPGLTLTESGQGGDRRNIRLLVNALSAEVPGSGFPPLPNVEVEVQNIRNTFGDERQTTLLNADYVVENIRQQIERVPEYTILHFASHGEFKGSADDTYLLTFKERLSLEGLQNLISPKKYGAESGVAPVDLLTLSACQTAAGDDRAALGLGGIAVKAGARSAVASLWYVSDASSTTLITKFYEGLAGDATITKAKALQEAQLSLLRNPDLSHPLYWAPYLVIGNWQ